MEIVKLSDQSRDFGPELSRIFVEGFYQWLRFFSKDRVKLTRAFAHSFNPAVFYGALLEGELAGMAACTDGKTPSMRLKQAEFRKHLGYFRGSMTYRVLKKEFEEKVYPFGIPSNMGMIEFVAVAEQQRGHGVATALLQRIHEITPYAQYALEAADTNSGALKLYQKLGYREFVRIPQPHAGRSGVNALLYLSYTKKVRRKQHEQNL